LDLRELRTFVAAVRWLNFSRAADELSYAQSTVSTHIGTLEEELGVRLFDRLGRRLVLTEAGERLAPYAEKILCLAEQTQADVGQGREASGHLTIRVPESMSVHRLPRVVARFQAEHPQVRFDFVDCAHESLGEDLRKGVTDLAFLQAHSYSADDLLVEELGTEQLVVVTHPDNPLAAMDEVRAADLEGEAILLSRIDCSTRLTFERIISEAGVQIGPKSEFTSVEALKPCVMAGVGITIIPAVSARTEIEAGQLAVVPWVEGGLEPKTLMIWHRAKWQSPTLRAFMDAVRLEYAVMAA
jgi:DNA-binding transcriptional LysR family regulator